MIIKDINQAENTIRDLKLYSTNVESWEENVDALLDWVTDEDDRIDEAKGDAEADATNDEISELQDQINDLDQEIDIKDEKLNDYDSAVDEAIEILEHGTYDATTDKAVKILREAQKNAK